MIGFARHFRMIRLGVIALAAFVLVPAVADAVLPGRNGRIAFTSGREGANDNLAQIYLRTVSGSSGGGLVSPPITPPAGQSRHASWSPDRTRIVFANGTPGSPTTEDYDLFVKDMVSGSITPLDGNEIGDGLSSDHPAWSPDGTKIAYEHQPIDNTADRNIMVKTVGTAAAAESLTTSSALEFKPAWTPDSQTIYYAKTVIHPNPDYDIMRQPAGGGSEVGVLTASGADEYQPSISPDGTRMCFTLQAAGNTSTADIYITSIPTVSAFTLMSPDATKGDINCTFSPDGTRIAYVNGVFSQGRLVMKPVSDPAGQPVLLEDDMGSNNFDGNPDWAPDGSPDCPDSTVSTPVDTPITIELECTDTGPLYEQTDPNGFVANDGGPVNGTTSDDAPLDNPSTVRYTPNAGFKGTDSIVFTSFDDFGFGTDKGTVTIKVGVTPPGSGPNTPGDGIIRGTPGDDNIKGTPGDDVINCGNGDDVVRAGGGNDVINCGPGNDRINAGGGNDRVRGGTGNDRIQGKNGNDVLAGNPGRDRASGGRGRDRIKGNGGPDRLFGGPGNDVIRGGPGRDLIRGGPGRDVKHP